MRAAAEAGLDVVALTDHDTAQGWAEATEAADDARPRPGDRDRDQHPLRAHGRAPAGLPARRRRTRPWSSPCDRVLDGPQRPGAGDPGQRLRAAGVELTEDDVRRVAAGTPATGRPHVADALVARGVVADRAEAFERYLNPGRPGYAGRYAADLEDVVPLVVAAGGVPVVAHPWARSARPVLTEAAFAQLRDLGLAGIEVDHQDHDAGRARGAARDRPQPRPGGHRVQRLPRHRQGRPRPGVQHHRARGARPDPRARRERPGRPRHERPARRHADDECLRHPLRDHGPASAPCRSSCR